MNKSKKDYIIKRIKERSDIYEKDLKALRENLNDFKSIKYILLEDYNFPDLYWRVYPNKMSFAKMLTDYFSDTLSEGESIYELNFLPIFYDVDKDRFVRVSYKIIEEVENENKTN